MTHMLTNDEAKILLNELKDTAMTEFIMPACREQGKGLDVTGRESKAVFRINMYRGTIERDKHSINARVKRGGAPLMRLCVGLGHPHTNPDGTVVNGSHLHMYREGYNDRFACPVNIASPDFVKDTLLLLQQFHVAKAPQLIDGTAA